MTMDEFDYVVVGAGSSGCVVAARLAEGGFSVCVLEAGPDDWNPYIRIPAGYVKNVFSKTMTWGFVTEPGAGLGGRKIDLTQGKVVGGSSSINGMVYNRGQRADYNGWAQMGNSGWSYDDVLPYFKKSEKRIGFGEEGYHGTTGTLTVTDPVTIGPLCDIFVDAAKSLGFPRVPDFNGREQEGVGAWQFTMDPTGRRVLRQSAARAFLKPAMKSGRISLRPNSPAQRIIFEGKQARGVAYRAGGPGSLTRQVRARREVIVSAGALNSARLLQISGIGPQEHLRSLGVDVVHDAPGVGANFTDHYQFRIAAKVRNAPTVNERSRGLPLMWQVANWAMGRPSILSMPPTVMRLFFRSAEGLEHPDVQISFMPGSYREGFPGLLDHYPGMSLGGYPQRPQSRGYVRARSTDVDVPPEVQPNYLDVEYDRRCMIAIFKMARRVFATPTFSQYYVEEMFPGQSVQSDDEILDFARRYGGTSYHAVGTVRMGPASDRSAVVDETLRVRGIDGLRVVDNSIMPSITSGPTNATAIMIGEKAADMIQRDVQARVAA
jgi:choline dehydrogenase